LAVNYFEKKNQNRYQTSINNRSLIYENNTQKCLNKNVEIQRELG